VSVAMIAMAGFVLSPTSPLLALDTPNERITLVGLTGVHVVVYDLRPEGDGESLTRSRLQAEVEKRLRLAGLRPLGAAEAMRSVGRPTLELRVNVSRSTGAPDLYVYSVDLALRQQIQLTRARTIESFAITWSEPPDVGIVDATQFSRIMNAVRAKVEQFLVAWRAANPD
jgi:hypothetical protein